MCLKWVPGLFIIVLPDPWTFSRFWRAFGACTGVIKPTEWSGIDPVLPGQSPRTLLRKHAIQKVHLRRDNVMYSY